MNVVKRQTYARLDDRAAAALLCGAVGLFLFNVVFGPIAIVLGAMALRSGGPGGKPGSASGGGSGGRSTGGFGRLGRAAALLGIGLGIADLVVLAVLVAGKVHGGNFDWYIGR